ncbi:MAG: type IX secretion system membrane protein PorP/SprF [Flavobacteriaceae bacterium]
MRFKIYSIVMMFQIFGLISHAQGILTNESHNIQILNPSYYGFNNQTTAGVIYNSINYDGIQNIDTKYGFTGVSFSDLNFAIGLDVVSHQVEEFGLLENQINLSYIYKMSLNYNTYFLPSLYIGFLNRSLKSENLVFEDQLNLLTGFIASSSIDPASNLDQSATGFDVGASGIIYNENYLLGLAIKHINQANISLNQEVEEPRDMSISLQAAYEFDLNKYNRSALPRNTYLFFYVSANKQGELMRFYANQELQLNSFVIGINQKVTSLEAFNFTNIGFNTGIAVGNIDFNVGYSFPVTSENILPPKVLEFSLLFNFDPYLSRNRGNYKRLKTDNF